LWIPWSQNFAPLDDTPYALSVSASTLSHHLASNDGSFAARWQGSQPPLAQMLCVPCQQ
jgi:hypothetical protein